MIKVYCKSIILEGQTEGQKVKKRQPEENTFGWRLMKAREDRQMSQKDVIEKLAKYKGKDIVSFCRQKSAKISSRRLFIGRKFVNQFQLDNSRCHCFNQ